LRLTRRRLRRKGVVKEADDAISASRYAMMSLRHVGVPEPGTGLMDEIDMMRAALAELDRQIGEILAKTPSLAPADQVRLLRMQDEIKELYEWKPLG
jgi:hypothetical protein